MLGGIDSEVAFHLDDELEESYEIAYLDKPRDNR